MELPAIKAGFVGFGEINTPPEMIERLSNQARDWLTASGLELVGTDPVTDDPDGRDVARACKELAGRDFDLLILCVAG